MASGDRAPSVDRSDAVLIEPVLARLPLVNPGTEFCESVRVYEGGMPRAAGMELLLEKMLGTCGLPGVLGV